MVDQTPTELLDTLSAPLGDLIIAVGQGVAEAQQAMDAQAINNFKSIHDSSNGDQALAMLQKLGYQPTWYQIPEATADLSVSLHIDAVAHKAGDKHHLLHGTPVDAHYTNRYSYDINAASRLTFRIVPVPPSSQAAEMKMVPNVDGQTFARARQKLEEKNIPYQADSSLTDDNTIVTTEPAAGEILLAGQVVQLSVKN